MPHNFFCASVCSHGCEGEDAVVQGRWVVEVLQHSMKQLEQLDVVRLERFRIRLHHLIQQQEANLFGKKTIQRMLLTKIMLYNTTTDFVIRPFYLIIKYKKIGGKTL